MAQFKIPDPKTIYPLDISNIGGCDEYSSVPTIGRSPDMKNIVNRFGMHEVRACIDQTYIVGPGQDFDADEDDIECAIKWVGKIEEYDDLGNPIPYYIKISEYLGEKDVVDDSYIYVSVWPTPDVRNIAFDMNAMPGCEKYRITYKKYQFTNYGKTGNDQGLYEEIDYDGTTYVFSPIGILSFNCFTTENGDIKTLDFNVKNVLDDPYVPTIKIAGSPNGQQGKIYEPINLLTNKRKYSVLGNGSATQYTLPEKVIQKVDSIKVLNNQGGYDVLTPTTDYSVNLITGVVTFTTAPGVSPVDGKDNVIIEYSKSPIEGNETNTFTMNTNGTNDFLKSTIDVAKATDQSDSEKIAVQLTIKIQKGSKYDATCNLKSCTVTLKAGNVNVIDPAISLTDAQMNTIRSGGTLTLNKSYSIPNDGASDNRKWAGSLSSTVTITTTTTTTTGVPGSVGAATSFGNQVYAIASGLNMMISARAVGHLGSASNGSDSYWDVYASPRINTPYSIQCSSRTVNAEIDGVTIGLATGGMYTNSGGTYPSSGEVHRTIPYSAGKTSVAIGVWCAINITWSGVKYNTVYSGYYYLALPKITPNSQKTVTTTSTSDTSSSISTTFTETLKNATETGTVSYENNSETSARLACYYATHATTVYGYENDRRVFVTNGGNCDTFSGLPVDPNYSTISYFPDVNYRVLGEEANILGYAQKSGYLFTIKEGGDSLYVRKGTSINDVVDFPSIFVKRNMQILCRPIEIEGSVFVITRNGLEELSYDYIQDYTYELVSYIRSYYITNYFGLGADYKYKQMQWYYENGLLHVFLDNYVFVFDLNSKSYVYTSSSSTGGSQKTGLPYQFESYVCTIPRLNVNTYAPKIKVYLPKDFERQDYGIVNTDVIPFGYNNTGIYKFDYRGSKVDKLKQIQELVDTPGEFEVVDKWYPIQAYYYTPFIDFNNISQLKTTKQIHIGTAGHNNDEYYIGYVLPDGQQLLLDKIINSSSDTPTNFRNSTTPFPKIIAIRNKIRKFTSVKLFLMNKAAYESVDEISVGSDVEEYNNMTFNRITIQYVNAGKYRGE